MTGLLAFTTYTVKAQYLSGYSNAIAGETIKYESQQPDATSALLVRSEEERKYIEWSTDPFPKGDKNDPVEFIMIAGIDVNPEDNHGFQMFINDELHFSFRNPLDTLTMNWDLEGKNGIKLRLQGMMIDKYGDLFGYLFLSVPRNLYEPGMPLRIKVSGETANSRSWFMVFKYAAVRQVKFIQEKALVKAGETENQLVRVDILHFDNPAMASIRIGKLKENFPLQLGFNMIRIAVPKVTEPKTLQAKVKVGRNLLADTALVLQPVKMKTIYLLPHSHNDIGYTHVQEEVEAIQWQNIRDAVRYSKETVDYPEGSRFRWNGEVMWAIDSYLEQCSEKEKAEFKEAVRKGWFELDGLYANILTGICRPEELFRMMESAVRISNEFDVPLTSAMISDIPGYSWGVVTAMAQSGVRYFSIGTNTFHRIGDIIETWGDKPFYWESQSGRERVLCWIHGKGYSDFHTGLAYTKLRNKLKEQLIFDYISELENSGYPYDLVTMRYNIGSDNGPPDPFLADIVKNWNEKYTSPKLVISTVGEAFSRFEQAYGHTLPSYRGDLTGYWEDGAGSSAKETAMNRASAERLTQASLLYSQYRPSDYPAVRFDQAWENILLYSEHTWGSWNSISEPHSPFTLQQWETKRSFAEMAEAQSVKLLEEIIPPFQADTLTAFDVYNSSSWTRTDLATIPAGCFTIGDRVTDDQGKIIPSQRLTTGELVFVATDIPAFSSRRYFVSTIESTRPRGDETDELFFPYDKIDLELDERTGAIISLQFRNFPDNLVDAGHSRGLNEYRYVTGRNPDNLRGVEQVKIYLKENGPVLKTLAVESGAPGCESLSREITSYKALQRIDIRNTLDKKDILEPEGVHFVFPFHVPGGVVQVSNAWGHYEVEKDQLPGSNRNFMTPNRWADVSNDVYGVTFVPVDAPLIEVGGITCDPIEFGWIDTLNPSQTIVSYVMNNYWETNYKASQPGVSAYRYAIYPHLQFDPLQAEKWGIEKHQPLQVIAADPNSTRQKSGIPAYDDAAIIVENIIPYPGVGLLFRIYNPGNEKAAIRFGGEPGSKNFYLCDPFGRDRRQAEDPLEIKPGEVLHIFREDE